MLPSTKRFVLTLCGDADADHARDPRRYAHVGHLPGKVCLASAFVRLPEGFQLGILLHELGHLVLLPRRHAERDADAAGGALAGVTVHRRDYRGAPSLEFVAPRDRSRALRAVRRLTNY